MSTAINSTVLLVQKDAGERSRVLGAFANAARRVRLCTAPDGKEAHAYLAGTGHYANREAYPIPQIILMDIDSAKESDMETLCRLCADILPVIGLTSGTDKTMIDRAYKLGTSSCVLKSRDESVLRGIAMGIADYAALLQQRA
jgi:DNA-binding NarL/FixJ family response regulator